NGVTTGVYEPRRKFGFSAIICLNRPWQCRDWSKNPSIIPVTSARLASLRARAMSPTRDASVDPESSARKHPHLLKHDCERPNPARSTLDLPLPTHIAYLRPYCIRVRGNNNSLRQKRDDVDGRRYSSAEW